jgi:hypothetical protein
MKHETYFDGRFSHFIYVSKVSMVRVCEYLYIYLLSLDTTKKNLSTFSHFAVNVKLSTVRILWRGCT